MTNYYTKRFIYHTKSKRFFRFPYSMPFRVSDLKERTEMRHALHRNLNRDGRIKETNI